MNTNDIRPAAIGVAAAVLAFAGLVAWVEIDPLDPVLEALARCKLTPQERAELDRMAAEDAERKARWAEQREAELAEPGDTFNPELLRAPGSVTSPLELSHDQLVAEYAHADGLWRSMPRHPNGEYGHLRALEAELNRRYQLRFHTRQPRSEQLRIDIARDQVQKIREAVFEIPQRTRPVPAADTIADDGIYPEFSGPAAADYGTDL
ncbi:hypothetical protein [Nocardia cyriacigeorgica]|uniref:hypothetical protein n=1 Tax=Nocardia cyriacigeorgica TaxID=135487 RepID=UPI003518C2F0